MKTSSDQTKKNVDLAKARWGKLSSAALGELVDLTQKHGLSVASGEIQKIDGAWYVTHSGLLRIAQRRRCHSIRTSLQTEVSDANGSRWVFKATIYKRPSAKGFVAYGDADPSNVSPLVRGAEMRVAETRAVNRALRKAYGIGLCSVEELGYTPRSGEHNGHNPGDSTSSNGHGPSNGQPKLRDQLCLLIRKHNLDPYQVKRYAADFCGTEELRGASRELVQSFIAVLAEQAAKDRAGLVCKLNSYGSAEAVKS